MSESESHPAPDASEPQVDLELEAAIAEYLELSEKGGAPGTEEFLARYPQHRAKLKEFLAGHQQMRELSSPMRGPEIVFDARRERPQAPRDLGPYEIIETIARGGMGVVYKARDRALDRIVALKVILSGPLASDVERERFAREAKVTSQLSHPNIIPVLEAGEIDGQRYYTMPLLEGGNLASRATDYAERPRAAAALVRTLAGAVQHAHERGILHRDLKPGNVVLQRDGTPCIADFGLAKLLGPGEPATIAGSIVGTPAYMAPELLIGGKADATTAADIFSLGAVLYELITGRQHVQATTPIEAMARIQIEDPIPPRRINGRIDRDLENICLRCLERDPASRYASAAALAEDLDRYLADLPVLARPVGLLERTQKWARRRPTVAALLAVCVLYGLIFLGREIAYGVKLRRNIDLATANRYAAEMNLGMTAWERGEVDYLRSILRRNAGASDGGVVPGFVWHHLRRRAGSLLLTVTHAAPARTVALDASAKLLAIGYVDGHAVLVDIKAQRKAMNLESDERQILGLSFSESGDRLAGLLDMEVGAQVTVWDTATGRKIRTFPSGHEGPAVGIAFLQEGLLATAGTDGRISLWDEANALHLETLDTKGLMLQFFDVSSDRKAILLQTSAGRLCRLPFRDGPTTGSDPASSTSPPTPPPRDDLRAQARAMVEEVSERLSHADWEVGIPRESQENGVLGIAQSAGERLFAMSTLSHSDEVQVSIWDVGTGVQMARLGGRPPIWSLCFSRDGRLLVTAGKDVRLWDVEAVLEPRILFAERPVCGVAAPDGGSVALANMGGKVSVVSTDSGQVIASLVTDIGAAEVISVDQAGETIALAGTLRQVELWQPAALEGFWKLGPHHGKVRSLAFRPGGRWVAVGSFERIVVWDLDSGARAESVARHGAVRSLAYTPSGEVLCAGFEDGAVEARTWRGGAPRLIRRPDRQAVLALAPTPDGRSVAAGLSNGDICLIDVAREGPLFEFQGHGAAVKVLAISPDGRTLVSADVASELRFWNLAMGLQLLRIDCEQGSICALGFDARGDELVAVTMLGRILKFGTQPEEPTRDTFLTEGPPSIEAYGPSPLSPGAGASTDSTTWTSIEQEALDGTEGCEGLAWEDFDGDRDLDLYVALPGSGRLFLNTGRGRIVDASTDASLALRDSRAVVPGDFDGDRDIDVYVTNRSGGNALLQNAGDGILFPAHGNMLPAIQRSAAATVSDYDEDGDLDLCVLSGPPPSRILRNDGLPGFSVPLSTPPGVGEALRFCCWVDFNNDGRPDLYTGTRAGPHQLLENLGKGELDPVNKIPGAAWLLARGGIWGDYDNDGDLDLYVYFRKAPNRLYRNEGNEKPFTNVTVAPLGDRGDARAAAWGDYDNDGDLDLFVANNDGTSKLLRNEGAASEPVFTDVTPQALESAGSAYALAWADVDADGDLDLTVSDWDNSVRIFRNDGPGRNRWLHVRLEGVVSNRQGIGARVKIVAGHLAQTREIGGGCGTTTQPFVAYFGLGEPEGVEKLEVRWPSGIVQTLEDVATNRLLVIREDATGSKARD